MERRDFLHTITGALALCVTRGAGAANAALTPQALEETRRQWQALLPKGKAVPQPTEVLTRSRDEWRRALSPAAYDVLREEGTERPFSSPLNDEKRPGVFACAGCGLPLFSSAMKFDSGTGWPSFVTSIPGHLAQKRDFKMILPRTEYHCVRCGGHQGHVFDDGPPPNGERWCNNGLALEFLPTRMA
ncbi:MAG: peptide-methionine (R)-S-oxide reductase MsrB [Pseudomonadota bacterium]|nr:peptide-methionine (R)-S-oxide reductase MsrB [Pseudomonadota bacterium]